jgi:hypothetical protein
MKLSQIYKQMVNDTNHGLPPVSNFPHFDAPSGEFPDPDESLEQFDDTDISKYYDLATKFQTASRDTLNSYLSYESFLQDRLNSARAKVLKEKFSDSKGSNADLRNAVVEADASVVEIRTEYNKVKYQRMILQGKPESYNNMAFIFGRERKDRRERDL